MQQITKCADLNKGQVVNKCFCISSVKKGEEKSIPCLGNSDVDVDRLNIVWEKAKSFYLRCLNEHSGLNFEVISTFVRAIAAGVRAVWQPKTSMIIRFISSYTYRRSYRPQHLCRSEADHRPKQRQSIRTINGRNMFASAFFSVFRVHCASEFLPCVKEVHKIIDKANSQ